MPLSAEQALLLEDYASLVVLSQLDALSPAQLAAAALRPDLAVLVRQRAYQCFSDRRRDYEGDNILLSSSLDFAPPTSDLTTLSPSQLLRLQFNPLCLEPLLVEAAGERFFALATEAKEDRRKRTIQVKRVHWRVGGWARMEGARKREEAFRVEEDRAEVISLEGGEGEGEEKVEVRFQAASILSLRFLPDPDDPAAFTLVFSLSTADFPLAESSGTCVELEVSFEGSSDGSSRAVLQEAITRWKRENGFKVEKDAPPAATPPPPPPPSAPAAPSRLPPLAHLPDPKRRRLSTSTSPDATSTRSVTESTPGQQDSKSPPAERPPLPEKRSPLWQFVGSKPAPVEWQPAFYARQFAFIAAVDPHLRFETVSFSDEELALLSFGADRQKLPRLPKSTARWHGGGITPNEQLAAEHLYPDVSLTPYDIRCILRFDSSASNPSFPVYFQLLTRVMEARDAAITAFGQLIRERLQFRLHDPETVDPIAKLYELVERLRDHERM
ncbi:hypothetical protein JCM8097_000916 [Rhodosporidiobolus ruineniae]